VVDDIPQEEINRNKAEALRRCHNRQTLRFVSNQSLPGDSSIVAPCAFACQQWLCSLPVQKERRVAIWRSFSNEGRLRHGHPAKEAGAVGWMCWPGIPEMRSSSTVRSEWPTFKRLFPANTNWQIVEGQYNAFESAMWRRAKVTLTYPSRAISTRTLSLTSCLQ